MNYNNLGDLEILKEVTDAESLLFYMNTYIHYGGQIEEMFPGQTTETFARSFAQFFMGLSGGDQQKLINMHNDHMQERRDEGVEGFSQTRIDQVCPIISFDNVVHVMSLFAALDKQIYEAVGTTGLDTYNWAFLSDAFPPNLANHFKSSKAPLVKKNPAFGIFVHMDRSSRKQMIYWMHRKFKERGWDTVKKLSSN